MCLRDRWKTNKVYFSHRQFAPGDPLLCFVYVCVCVCVCAYRPVDSLITLWQILWHLVIFHLKNKKNLHFYSALKYARLKVCVSAAQSVCVCVCVSAAQSVCASLSLLRTYQLLPRRQAVMWQKLSVWLTGVTSSELNLGESSRSRKGSWNTQQ